MHFINETVAVTAGADADSLADERGHSLGIIDVGYF